MPGNTQAAGGLFTGRRWPRAPASAAQPADDAADDTRLDQVLDRQLLTGALQRLSPAHRTVLVETFYHGGTLAAVARQLQIPPGTARSLRRLRRRHPGRQPRQRPNQRL